MRVSSATLARSIDPRGLCPGAVGALEPHVPWNRAFLSLRLQCYAALGDRRLDAAKRDLADFLSHEAVPLNGIRDGP